MPSFSPDNPCLGRVLVVDDIAANVRLLAGILKVADYDVLTAESGADALQKVEEFAPDVVMLDVMMPEMDGFEVCRRLRENPRTAALPVVMVTALHETEDRVRALEAGADDFLTKPVNEIEVVARVKSLVRVKRGRDELETALSDLQRAESLRDSLASMLVHDLRAPLTTILAPLEMLSSNAFGELNEMQSEVAEMATRGANRLLYLVNELLDVSKLESGNMTLQPSEFQVAPVVEEALELTGVLAGRDEQLVEREYSNDFQVRADEDLLRRVLSNLLSNAVKFTPSDGRIGVGAKTGDNEVLFWVRDEGDGVPPEYRDKIFEKFGQVESRQEGRKLSTGLGLTFCKLAVEAHGGRIWIESEAGRGSTFFFTLPQ